MSWREIDDRESRFSRGCIAAAFALTLGWFFVYHFIHGGALVDEPGHLGDIYHFLEGKRGWPESMPMLPGYHFMVVGLQQLGLSLAPLTLARLVTTAISLLGLAAFALAWRHVHQRPAGRAVLLLALLPIAQPFTGMAYTDMPALAFVFCAWWAHVTGRQASAAGLFAAAACLRQTNLVWVGFVVAWEFLRSDVPRRDFFRRTKWLLLLLAISTAIVLWAGRLTVGDQHGNAFRPNIATLHFAGLMVLMLGLPVWIAHTPSALRRACEAVRTHPLRGSSLLAIGFGAATFLAFTYANPHIWNRDLFWEGCSFTLLRNWPLVWIDRSGWLRAISGLVIVTMVAALAATFRAQRYRLELGLALGFGALLPFTNSLVEPRYFISSVAVVLFFLELAPRDWWRLAFWWAGLCAIHAPFVVTRLSLW